MDPKKLFADERFSYFCVYCGDKPTTRDHVPSKVLLDEPFPDNLPVVQCCEKCNQNFSRDEIYLACLVECVINGSVSPDRIQRDKIKRILREKNNLAEMIDACRCDENLGNTVWNPDHERVKNIVLKLARGHVAYECSEQQMAEPEHLVFRPLSSLSTQEALEFETPPDEHVLPEIGSRAFHRVLIVDSQVFLDNGWHVVQPGRYRYLVSYSGSIKVRFVLSEYLACEVVW